MGASSSSTGKSSAQEIEVHELEARLTATGDLPLLQHVFTKFSRSSTSASVSTKPAIPFSTLQATLSFSALNIKVSSNSEGPQLSKLIQCIGPSVAEVVFEPEKDVDWMKFLKGYEKHCKQSFGATKLKNLMILLCQIRKFARLPSGVNHTSQVVESFKDADLEGLIAESQVREFLSLCWLMMSSPTIQKASYDASTGQLQVELPDIETLVRASMLAGHSGRTTDHVERLEIPHTDGSDKEIPIQGLFSWMLATIPGVSNALPQYVQDQLVQSGSTKMGENKFQKAFPEISESTVGSIARDKAGIAKEPIKSTDSSGLLNIGRAWAVGLSLQGQIGAELVKASGNVHETLESHINLLYRSSVHGQGMNRFWKQVEGYKGPVLILLAAKSSQKIEEDGGQNAEESSWVLGFFVPEGLENKASFYGGSGCCIFAIEPEFHPFRTTGRDRCFVYSYKQAPGSMYSSQPKQEGIGFGGGYGKQRVWLDDDFLSVTVRHHAVDKSYQSGKLVPGQGYGNVGGKVLEVEVWGLGGLAAEEKQTAYQQRQNVFLEQRRKVDLKAFGDWEESPEKAMLNLLSDPTKVAREDR
ncbi:hypothetical protein O6H91_06G058600 [Diphasiastrum complanatum]|uniref:Uncharacterized protein n=1 Tax=Diphasiastrum complanatum TaxID=34168 RepID=A0ACC2DEH7_DIPCM|nr:hypothetical protein O6H91_06G058600 [Diphasiastrum complanatum]